MEAPIGPLESCASCASGGAARAISPDLSESCISESGQSHTYGVQHLERAQRVTHCVRGVRRRVWDGDESRRATGATLDW